MLARISHKDAYCNDEFICKDCVILAQFFRHTDCMHTKTSLASLVFTDEFAVSLRHLVRKAGLASAHEAVVAHRKWVVTKQM